MYLVLNFFIFKIKYRESNISIIGSRIMNLIELLSPSNILVMIETKFNPIFVLVVLLK